MLYLWFEDDDDINNFKRIYFTLGKNVNTN